MLPSEVDLDNSEQAANSVELEHWFASHRHFAGRRSPHDHSIDSSRGCKQEARYTPCGDAAGDRGYLVSALVQQHMPTRAVATASKAVHARSAHARHTGADQHALTTADIAAIRPRLPAQHLLRLSPPTPSASAASLVLARTAHGAD
ncbi:hypothetical protein EX895_004984 [Sporisorium graminicola]|uniref:Uncharacterized protein n=1 Tax=Sporisorium graminicola TaxID=280036 RepID=A0A4V6ETC8_9BASI|nr:hypothetical protein EX895_004984 [Sporisorium graminicola]TKY86159.1 hypothetical protein EX895_004984 [Sporisorium graminicola]